MSYHTQNNEPFAVFLVVGCLLGLLFFKSPMAGGDVPIGYPHEIRGTVIKEPSVRYVRSADSGQEKVALSLGLGPTRVPPTLSSAYQDHILTVECMSTRCTQILLGETHTFACRGDGRLFEPNVVVCKHVAQVK